MEENFLGEGNESGFPCFSILFVLRATYIYQDKIVVIWAGTGTMAYRNNANYTRLMAHFHTNLAVLTCAFVPN